VTRKCLTFASRRIASEREGGFECDGPGGTGRLQSGLAF
jgi:hypothetical protein